ncbi:fibronectin type III domain-containing protein [Cytophaga hutchinsonii]|uniref:fibronectin type III domain-containing protein n=1 Tax=Cytophaga hutchinsonii TaxID=985 RepID=UPI0005A5188E|nr:fibronectin type III domain-containing protein [Cytophaga hutchinsonii]
MSTNKLSMRILFLVLVCMSIISTPVQYLFAQQQYPVQIQPSVSFPSTFLSDYADPANTSIRVYLADMTKQNYTINIRIQLTSTNISYTSLYGINVTLDGGQVYFLNANELARLFALTDLKVVASSQGNEPNSLPEGSYNLALQAFDVTLLPTLVPVSNIRTDFTIFNVVRYDPPLLNAPMNKQEFDLQTTNQNIFFNWTPRHIVYSPNQRIQYRYRMIRVIPVDRNPYDAVNTSLAGATGNIDVNNLDFPAFSYSPADLKLEPGAVYAWQVQAYETVNGQKSTSRFKNQGYSEVFTFSVKEHCEQITLGTPLVMGNSVKFNWNSGISSEYKEYEFNYRKVGSNTGWIPVSTLENTITLDNTVLETGVSYEYNVRARCNNWLLPVQGENFTLATPTCVPPSPLTVNTSGNATVLSWPQAKSVDSLKLYYKITGSSDPYKTLGLNAADVQCSLPLLTSGGYTIHLDALCGTEQSAGAENSFAFDETGIVGPCPIPLPFQLTANRIKGDTASLQWNTVAGAHTGSGITYWHKDSSTVTYTLSAITTSAGTGVSGRHIYNDQVYSYQITYQCGNKTKVTPVGMFRILSASAQVAIDPQTANCFPPVDIRAEARDSVSARVEWDKISGAESYELSYRVKGTTGLFTTFNTTAISTTLKPLQANAQYQLLVRVKCNGLFSIYSDTALLDLTVARNRNCDTIAYFKTLNKTTGNIQVAWDYDSTNTGYIIKYREEAQPIATEYTQAFTNIDSLKQNNLVLPDTFKYTFQNLKAGTKYIFRIQKICGQNNALFNAPLVVSTMPDTKSTGACGSGNVCDKNPATKLQSLKVTDTIYCADYLVVVDSITTATSNPSMGLYSGLGHMEMPVPGLGDFVNMHVSFNNVKINGKPNSCVYDGTINIDSMNASIIPIKIRDSIKAIMAKAEEVIDQANEVLNQIQTGIDDAQAATQDGIDYFQGGEGVGNVKTGGLGETEAGAKISKTTRTATVGTNSVTIDGRTVPVTSVPVLIKDSDGQVFQVSPAGVVTYLGVYNTAFAKDTTLDLSAQIVTYEEAAGAVYDFDKRETAYSVSTQIDREYEKIGTSYYVPAKFITPGALDKVTATVSGSSADPAKVVFTNGKGFVYEKGTATGNSFTLNVAGGPASDGQYIYAWYVDGDSKKAIGKLLLPSYAPQVKNVVIVPVKGNQTFNPATYETYLNQTYQKVGITYHVTLDNTFRTNTAWSTDGNLTVQSSASGLLSNDYQGKEKAIVQAYVAFKGGAANIDSTAAYFMAVYEPSSIKDGTSNLLGKMPAEEQFGFLYSGSFPASGSGQDEGLKRTMAHELGHGAYHMEHTFNAIYLRETSRNNTTNLMDYAAGNQLWKFQWDIIHAPGHVWGILKRDRDAQLVRDPFFFNPGGIPFKIKTDLWGGNYKLNVPISMIENGTFPNGVVYGWYVLKNDVKVDEFRAKIQNGKFLGYYQVVDDVVTNNYYDDGVSLQIDYSFELNDLGSTLYLANYIGRCNVALYKTEYTIRGTRKTESEYKNGSVKVIAQINNYLPISLSEVINYQTPCSFTNGKFAAGEYATYDDYKKVLGANAQPIGSDTWSGAWLKSDRINRTQRWINAMEYITLQKWHNVLRPYHQVSDYYLWAQWKAEKLGHEIRWAKGAAYLVDDLGDGYESGATSANITDMGERMGQSILSDLNMGILNYAMDRFNDLFYGPNRHVILKGNAAYLWDLSFIKEEQGDVAYGVYPNYKNSEELTTLKNITRKEGMYGTGSVFIARFIPNFAVIEADVSDANTRYGEVARINIPMFMLWPNTHDMNAYQQFTNPYNLSNHRTPYNKYLISGGKLNVNYVTSDCVTTAVYTSPGTPAVLVKICNDKFVEEVLYANSQVNRFYESNKIQQ